MQVTRDRTERPHGALLQFDIEYLCHMYRIGRSHRDRDASFEGGAVGILPLCYGHSNPVGLSSTETVSDGQFDWGGRLLKGNGGAQRFPQNGWKSFAECKGIRELDCESYNSSRDESRA